MPEFIAFLRPARAEMPENPTEEEQRAVGEHFAYLKAKLTAGELVLAGRTYEPPFVGIAVFEADDRGMAEQFVASDPAVRDGVFVAELQEYRVALMRGKE